MFPVVLCALCVFSSQLVFKSKNTLVYKARRRAGTGHTEGGGGGGGGRIAGEDDAREARNNGQIASSAIAGKSGGLGLAGSRASPSAADPSSPTQVALPSASVVALSPVSPFEFGSGSVYGGDHATYETVILKMPNVFHSKQGAAAAIEAGGIIGVMALEAAAAAAAATAAAASDGSPTAAVNSAAAALTVPLQHFTAAQSAKMRQFLQQCSIAKTLQQKNVQGLVELYELLQIPVSAYHHALFPILVFSYFDGPMLSSIYANPRYQTGQS